jgi:hypothetical protein
LGANESFIPVRGRRYQTSIAVYLYINAAMYLFFAIWQTFSPWSTATAIGYEALTNSARSEYLVVYGGFQLGLTAFFCWAATSEITRHAGLIFAVCLYVPIVPYRLITVASFWPVSAVPLIIGSFECALLITGVALLFTQPRRQEFARSTD